VCAVEQLCKKDDKDDLIDDVVSDSGTMNFCSSPLTFLLFLQ